MKIILDIREKDLINECQEYLKNDTFKDIEITTENLEIGDIIIKDDEKELLIYERKTISDLVASIKDGRYTEQSYRLDGLEHHNHNIGYIIEGTIPKNFKDKQMVFSAMFSLNYYKGFSVIRSFNIQETAYIICNACLKLKKEKDKQPYYTDIVKENSTEEKSYCSVIKKKKNANITVENFGEIVLSQIPSISSVTACAIMREYKTIDNLIEVIKENENVLDGITYETSKGQTRKVSKTSIKNIINFLVNK